jgi:hypothetical protein
MSNFTELRNAINEYLIALRTNNDKRIEGNPYSTPINFTVQYARRYAKVVQAYEGSESLSVHAFIDLLNGDVIKPAGWKAPQKEGVGLKSNAVRFNLLDPESKRQCFERADFAGSYLYKNN